MRTAEESVEEPSYLETKQRENLYAEVRKNKSSNQFIEKYVQCDVANKHQKGTQSPSFIEGIHRTSTNYTNYATNNPILLVLAYHGVPHCLEQN